MIIREVSLPFLLFCFVENNTKSDAATTVKRRKKGKQSKQVHSELIVYANVFGFKPLGPIACRNFHEEWIDPGGMQVHINALANERMVAKGRDIDMKSYKGSRRFL